MPTCAWANEEKSSKYEISEQFLNSLGIVDKTDDFEREISRGEFVSLAVKILNSDFTMSPDGSVSDVPSDHMYAKEIYTAYKLRLLRGHEGGNFMPDSEITYAQAIKILVAALGYEDYAYVSGGYPAGYIMAANSIDLTKGVSGSADEKITLGKAYILIANALQCDVNLTIKVSDEVIYQKSEKGRNCLSEYFGFSEIKGVLYSAGFLSMNENFETEKNVAEIDGRVFDCYIEGIEGFLGKSVKGWYSEEEDTLRAIMEESKNAEITLSAEKIAGYNDFVISYEKDESVKTLSYRLDKGYTFLLNGRAISPVEEDFLFDEGSIKLLDNDGDGDYDVVFSQKKEYFVVSGIDSYNKTIYDRNKNGEFIVLKNEKGYKFSLSLDGIAGDHTSLFENTVLMAYKTADGYVADVYATTDKIKGTVTEVYKDELTIDGNIYKTNSYFKQNCSVEPGQSATFLLAPDGTITYISSLGASGIEYAYFLDMASEVKSLSEGVKIRIVTQNGYFTETLAEKVTLDGETMSRGDVRIKNKLMNGTLPNYQLIRVGKDESGLVNVIDTSEDAQGDNLYDKYQGVSGSDNSLTKFVDATKTSTYWRSQASVFIPFFTVGDTVLISVPSELRGAAATARYEEDTFRIINQTALSTYGTYYIDAFDYDSSLTPKVVVIYNGEATAGIKTVETPSNREALHVVEKVVDTVTDEGEITKKIYTYSGREFTSYIIDPELLDSFKALNLIPSSGDIIRFTFGLRYINGIAIDAVYDAEKDAVVVNYGKSNVNNVPEATLTYISGKLFSKVSKYSLSIKTDNYPTSTNYAKPIDGICNVQATNNTVVVFYNKQTKTIEHGTLSALADMKSVGEENASYMCVRTDGYVPKLIVVYR